MEKELKIRMALVEAIDDCLGLDEFDGLCWYGENHVYRMADAALAVLMATKEAQDYMRDNDEKPI